MVDNEKKLVQADETWLEYIKKDDTPNSHKMFTDQSYHYSFWQNAEHSIILIDEKGHIISCNPRFLTLTGNTLAELKGCNFYDMIDRRYFRADQINLEAIVNSNIYSHVGKTQLATNRKDKHLIPVKMVATRVPSTLNHPFRHLVIHLYEMPDAVIVRNREVQAMQPFDIKNLLMSPWFIKSAMWLIGLLAVLISLSGQLQPILHKLIDKI